jgi:hypothetical protein
MIDVIELNKYLTHVIGECWHEPVADVGDEYPCRENNSFKGCDFKVTCSKCGSSLRKGREYYDKEAATKQANSDVQYLKERTWNDFLTWPDCGKLLIWVTKQEWLDDFIKYLGQQAYATNTGPSWGRIEPKVLKYFNIEILNPGIFPDLVYNFLIERDKK